MLTNPTITSTYPLHRGHLLISQQRRPLPILTHNLSPGERIAAQQSRHADSQREYEEQPANREGEDPLQLQDRQLAEELSNTSRRVKLVSIHNNDRAMVHLQNARTLSAKPIV